jgi:hypothetical protein
MGKVEPSDSVTIVVNGKHSSTTNAPARMRKALLSERYFLTFESSISEVMAMISAASSSALRLSVSW